MDKYAIYLRKSRADVEAEKLGEGETLARHKKILLDLAARKELYVDEIYHEIVSGADAIKDRPEIQRLIADCYAGKYKGILIVEITRLSRGSQGDAQLIMDCLKYANQNDGLLVITPNKTYDVAHNSDDEEYMEFELFMSRREYKMIRRRMERGRLQAVVEGNYMGSYRPYGYNIVKTKTGRTLAPNLEEAPVVRQIFDWTVKYNMTPGAIARKLTNLGVPTYTGEPEWSCSTIKTILNNPTYIGKVRWNDRMQTKTMINGEIVTRRPRTNHTEQYMLYDGKHKEHALVDEETYYAASNRFYSDKTKYALTLHNPLAGIFFCKHCGKAMVYQRYSTREHVQPRFVHKPSQSCKVKSVYAKDVMDAVSYSLRLYIEDFEVKICESEPKESQATDRQIKRLHQQIEILETKLSKLFNLWEEGHLTDNEFIKRKQIHNDRIEFIKKQIEDMKTPDPEKDDYGEVIIMLSDALKSITDDAIDTIARNQYLKRIIDRIEFSRENQGEFVLDVYLKHDRCVVRPINIS